jgi:rod shape-determining protein MreC
MRNLLAFFLKHQFFSLFIILEIISFTLLTNSYSYQRMLRFNAASDISGTVYNSYHTITSYLNLKEKNKQLLEENSRLYNMLLTGILASDSISSQHKYTSYEYIPATVIRNTVNPTNNFIVLNKGEKQGIQKEMGLVSNKGIAGIVIGVSKNYAIAMSLLNTHTHISARIKKNDQLVNVIWDENHGMKGMVIDIPAHIQLQKGDTIVTSGNSFIFPAGLNVGIVTAFEKSKNNSLNKAQLQFCTDFNSLHYVYVIKNLDKKEELKLLEEAEDE